MFFEKATAARTHKMMRAAILRENEVFGLQRKEAGAMRTFAIESALIAGVVGLGDLAGADFARRRHQRRGRSSHAQ